MLDELARAHKHAWSDPKTREALATVGAWLERVARPSEPAPGSDGQGDIARSAAAKRGEGYPAKPAEGALTTMGLCVVCLEPGCERDDCRWVPWPGEVVDYATALADMRRRPEARYEDLEGDVYAVIAGKLVRAPDSSQPAEDERAEAELAALPWRRNDVPERGAGAKHKQEMPGNLGGAEPAQQHVLPARNMIGETTARPLSGLLRFPGGGLLGVAVSYVESLGGEVRRAWLDGDDALVAARYDQKAADALAPDLASGAIEYEQLSTEPARHGGANREAGDLYAQLAELGQEAAREAWTDYAGDVEAIPQTPEWRAWSRLGAELGLVERGALMNEHERRVFIDAYRAELQLQRLKGEG